MRSLGCGGPVGVLDAADYLRLIPSLAKLPHAPKPVRFTGLHWKL